MNFKNYRKASEADIRRLLVDNKNWGRWGEDDELGLMNLITDEKRVAAAALVSAGKSISLRRDFPTTPAGNNPRPAQHYVTRDERAEQAGHMGDFVGIECHGAASTHIDALCHIWDEGMMWNGRLPDQVISPSGCSWAGVENGRHGVVTRGVLLDVPAYRGEPYVRYDAPVHGDELAEIARAQGTPVEPGDCVAVYSARERWDEENPVWGSEFTDDGRPRRPGLHASCLAYLRSTDCAVLAWDMQDFWPNEWDLPWTVHAAIAWFGLAIVDHCTLGDLALTCRELGRYEFMFVCAPLPVVGASGSPLNPLAVL